MTHRPAPTSNPYPERMTSLAGVRQHNLLAPALAKKVTTASAARPRHPFAANNLPATVAVVVMFGVVLSAMTTAVLVLYADHPRRASIAVGCIAVEIAWTALLALPVMFRRPHMAAPAPVATHEAGDDQAATNAARPVRLQTEVTSIGQVGGRA